MKQCCSAQRPGLKPRYCWGNTGSQLNCKEGPWTFSPPLHHCRTYSERGRQGLQDALVPGPDAETQVVQQLTDLGQALHWAFPAVRCDLRLLLSLGERQAGLGPIADAWGGQDSGKGGLSTGPVSRLRLAPGGGGKEQSSLLLPRSQGWGGTRAGICSRENEALSRALSLPPPPTEKGKGVLTHLSQLRCSPGPAEHWTGSPDQALHCGHSHHLHFPAQIQRLGLWPGSHG